MNKLVGLITLLLLGAPASHAESGRLFYTPEQRAALEKARVHNRMQAPTPGLPAPPRPVTYDGFVQRSDGHITRWVNGKAQPGGGTALNVRGRALQPGQTLDGRQVYEAHGIRRPDLKETP